MNIRLDKAGGAALIEALVAATLLAFGVAGHLRMLSTATQALTHTIWHTRAQHLNQSLLALLHPLQSATDLSSQSAAVIRWEQSAQEQLPGGTAQIDVSRVGNLQRIELRITWQQPGQGAQTASSYLFRPGS